MASVAFGMAAQYLATTYIANTALWASVGYFVGSTLGSYLTAEDTEVTGPRLSDLDPKISSYNRVITRVYGTERVIGNIIWKQPLVEVRNKEEEGGKGGMGGGSTTSTTFSYNGVFAVGIAEGEQEFIQVWGGDKLIFDAEGSDGAIAKYRNVMTFYTGTETQDPDPTMESYEGVGWVPAHRGLCYIVFNNLPLADFGNRLPVISAKIGAVSDTRVSVKIADSYGSFSAFPMAPDRHTIYAHNGHLLHSFSIYDRDSDESETTISTIASYGIWDGSSPQTCTDGEYYYLLLTKSPNGYAGRVHIATGTLSRISSSLGSITTNTGNHRTDIDGNVYLTYADGVWYGSKLELGTGQYITQIDTLDTSTLKISQGVGWDMWVVTTRTSDNSFDITRYNRGVQVGTTFNIPAGYNVDSYTAGCFYHTPTGYLVFPNNYDAPSNSSRLYAVDVESETLAWSTDCGSYGSNELTTYMNAEYTCEGNFFYRPGNKFYNKINLATGEIIDGDVDYDLWDGVTPGSSQHSQFYDEESHALIIFTGGVWRSLPLDRKTGVGTPVSVQSILEDICTGSPLLEAADIDASDLSDDYVTGYKMDSRAPRRNYIEPLMLGFFFDVVESDDILKFVQRDGGSDVAIPQSKLIANGEVFVATKTQEVELPNTLELVFIDPDADFQNHIVSDKRVDEAVITREKHTINLGYAITVTQAADIVKKWLHLLWVERYRYRFELTWEYLKYEPTDGVTVTFNGVEFPLMLERVQIGADLVLRCEGVATKAISYTLKGSGQEGLGYIDDVLALTGPTILHLLDLPAMRSNELYDPTLYIAGNGYYAAWRGCVIQRSTDAIEYTQIDTLTREATVGKVINTVPSALHTVVDYTNSVNVTVYQGEDNISTSNVSTIVQNIETNLALVGDELIQFAVASATGQYVSLKGGLIRGRFGTEHHVGGHTAGERFVLMTQSSIDKRTIAITEVDQARYYRGISFGAATEDATPQGFTYAAENLKPWSVVHIRGARTGNDLALNWVRRSRRQAQTLWSPALQEESESYSIDVYNSANGSVVDTLTAAQASTNYTSTQQASVGLTPGQTLYVQIFQISADVGRGNGTTATV